MSPERSVTYVSERSIQQHTVKSRFFRPFPARFTIRCLLGYLRNRLSQQFLPQGAPPRKAEDRLEFNTLLDVAPMLLVQPVILYYGNVVGRTSASWFLDSESRWSF